MDCWDPAQQTELQKASSVVAQALGVQNQAEGPGWGGKEGGSGDCHKDPQGTLNPRVGSFTETPQIVADLSWASASSFENARNNLPSPCSAEILTFLEDT